MSNLMQGFPPPPEAQVTLANWRKPPFNRWAFQHVREIVPSAEVAHNAGNIRLLPEAPTDLSGVRVPDHNNGWTMAEFLAHTNTDALVVLHRGKLVYQHYANGMTPETPHILMSVSKSVLGLITGIVAARGDLDVNAPVAEYVPEIAGTAYQGATVRHLLDMRSGVKFDEDYLATSGAIIEYRKATNWEPLDAGQKPMDLRGFYQTLAERDGVHGRPWHYISINTDLLGWVLERATGQRYADLASETLWRRIGAAHSAYITVDRLGAPRAAGGFCCTVPDLARIGLMVAEGGNGIVPESWLTDIANGGDRTAWNQSLGVEKYPDLPMRYRSQWYVLDRASPLIFAIGIFGQSLYVDRDAGFVMAKFSSQDLPLDTERKLLTIRAAEAIRDHLAG